MKDKNIRPLGSLPLMAWSINLARFLGYPVVVSTDSERYAAIARDFGAQVLMRPAEISGDDVGDLEVVQHFISQFSCDLVLFLRPTTPFRTLGMIEAAIQTIQEASGCATSLRSVELMGEGAVKSFTLAPGPFITSTVPFPILRRGIKIREMKQTDVKAVCELILRCFEFSFAADYTEAGRVKFRQTMSEQSILERWDSGSSRFWVFVEDISIKGMAETKGSNHLALLMVDPTNQKMGIGQELLAAAKQSLGTIIYLNSSINAVPFYQRFGFRICGDRGNKEGQSYIPMKANILDISNMPAHLLEETYRGNGYIDIILRKQVETGDLWGDRCIGLVTPRVPEIDTEDDFLWAEYWARRKGVL